MPPATPSAVRRVSREPALEGKTGHIAVLDGVRGLAILLVMAHTVAVVPGASLMAHLVNAVSNLGSAGIDLFFVLSGFLITGILLETREQPRYFRNFYVRRGLRIFPIYYGYLLVYAAARLAYPAAIDPPAVPHEAIWVAVFGTNILSAIKQTAVSPALSHLWPLAIAVHFYLIWPLLIYLVPARRMLWACGGFVMAAFLMRLVFWMHNDFYAGYMLTACRLDGLAVGTAIAIVSRQPGMMARWVPAAKWVGVAALAALGAGMARRHGLKWGAGFSLTAGITLLAIFYGCCVLVLINVDRAKGRMGAYRVLDSVLLLFFGKYSLALYVVQAPIQMAVSFWMRNVAMAWYIKRPVAWMALNAVIVVGLSIAVAWVSWRILESPFLKLKRYFAPRPGEVAGAQNALSIAAQTS